MSNFKAKMPQIQFRPGGALTQTPLGVYSAPLGLVALFEGHTFEGGEGKCWRMGGWDGRGDDKTKHRENIVDVMPIVTELFSL